MTEDDLAALTALEAAASVAQWHVVEMNDDLCMSAILVTMHPATGRGIDVPDDAWREEDVVAACLLQSPAIATVADRCWAENARLIATVRNALPGLLALARVGLKTERCGET